MAKNQQPVNGALATANNSRATSTQQPMLITLVDENGDSFSANSVAMTGYTSQSAGNVAPTDTVAEAIAKLEARVAAIEAV